MKKMSSFSLFNLPYIHLFGMSLIFIFMGMVVLFLDLSPGARTWLIVLPFIGVTIDLASAWLKVFVHTGWGRVFT